MLDTGVDYTHTDLAENMWIRPESLPEYTDDELGTINDLHGFDANVNASDPMDENGHGTHCSGIIGAEGDNGEGIAGINWHVKIMPLKFLGRGGFAILGHLADVLDVRIVAPAEVRAQRVMARENLATLPEAQARVAEDDHMRQRFVQLFYDRPWDDPTAFDLRIDTGSVSYDAAAQQIVDAARALEQKQFGGDAVTTAGLEVDPVLADAVAKVLAYPLAPLRS